MKHLHRNICCAFLTLCLAVCCIDSAWAIKASPKSVAVKQPDGTTLTLRIHGDENFHYTTTTDGFLVRRDKDGYFKYISLEAATTKHKLSSVRAHNLGSRSADETRFVGTLTAISSVESARKMFPALASTPHKAPQQILNQKNIGRNHRLARSTESEAGESQYLVILVNYADGKLTYGVDDFEKWLNEPGYAVDGGTGSVKDYYRDNSMGKFIPNFTVLGPYTLAHNESYYAANDSETSEDCNPQEMIREAVESARADHPELDFSQFDNDGDGYMDNINVIFPGYSEASSGETNDMWPHSYNLTKLSAAFNIACRVNETDSITVNNYSVSAELVGSSGGKMDGIGTFTHEFGHILGLRDLYDTDDYTDGIGLNPGDYSIYASGSYNNESRTPPYLMAFERQQMGWLELQPIDKAEDVSLEPIYKNTARYIDAQPNLNTATDGMDWYVLENRQQTGWDKYIPYHGLLIYHYDYTTAKKEECWDVNGPNNNARHLCMYIVPADGINDDLTRKGDTFPGTTGTTDFTDETFPDAISWTGEKLHTPITNITEEADGIIRFQTKGGTGTQSFVRTTPPTDAQISDTTIVLGAKVIEQRQDIVEMGFCWSATNDFPTTADDTLHVQVADAVSATLSGLSEFTTYYVRAYMTLADSSTIYGASVPVRTEHHVYQAPYAYIFNTFDGAEPLGWRIIDNNGDGMTWIEDASTSSIVYQFDYWNNADDWLISEKMHVPEHGALYVVRGVTSEDCVEKLDICVSTESREISDFHLVKSLTLADQFGIQAVDEIDLSEYAGKDVYVALVAKSDKMQNSLWLWEVLLTNRLETPIVTDFSSVKGGLHAAWTPIDGAKYYYLDFYEVTDSAITTEKYLPEADMVSIKGDVEVGTGLLKFTGSGSVETTAYPEGINVVQYILYSSGPRGTATLSVEGSTDGENWQRIGELKTISSTDTDGTLVDLTDYMSGTSYTRLRVQCETDSRLITLRNFAISYNNGYAWESLSYGTVDGTEITINEKTSGEFETGKKYVIEVFAGDGLLFYDASTPAYYQNTTGITEISQNAAAKTSRIARTLCADGIVRLSGLEAGKPVTLYAADGRVLAKFVPISTSASIRISGYKGVIIGKQ